MLSLKAKACVHNRFDLVVRDAKTGRVKQRAYAFNVVLNNFFTTLPSYDGQTGQLLYQLRYGTGAGTPAVTDTALFSDKGGLSFGTAVNTYGATSTQVASCTMDVNTGNGLTITEVGIQRNGRSSWPANSTILISHAMLKDSEGNQIAINKTNTDVIVITATIFMTLTNVGFGTNGIYPSPSNNELVLRYFLGRESLKLLGGYIHNFRYSNIVPANGDEIPRVGASVRMKGVTIGTDGTFAETGGLDPGEADKKSCRLIGLDNIGAVVFPDHSIFPPYPVSNLAIGTGDGATTDFSAGAPYIMEGSETVTVDGAVKTKGADYTIDYASNPYDQVECYHTSGLRLGGGITIANINNTGSSQTYDPFFMGSIPLAAAMYSAAISATNPIVIDLGAGKPCNRFRSWNDSSAPVIQYSADNQNWAAVTGLVSATLSSNAGEYGFKFDAVTARYWRIYWSSSKTIYFRASSHSVDGIQSTALYALGYSAPGLHLLTAPASGKAVQISYNIDIPYKTSNNKLTFGFTWQIGRG